jgi:hypothetical protein
MHLILNSLSAFPACRRVSRKILSSSLYVKLTVCVSAAGNGSFQGDGERIHLLPEANLKPDPDPDPGSTQAQG